MFDIALFNKLLKTTNWEYTFIYNCDVRTPCGSNDNEKTITACEHIFIYLRISIDYSGGLTLTMVWGETGRHL